MSTSEQPSNSSSRVAIVGMAGRFPGARNLDQFWSNLASGKETISRFTDDELRAEGIDSATLENPFYVKARGVLDDAECFDALLFRFPPGEAAMIDPQHRVLLEVAWEALESAGYSPETPGPNSGVFVGCAGSTYFLMNVLPNVEVLKAMGPLRINMGHESGFLPTRISFKLGLCGPSINVQSACSTSLVAVHIACQALLNRECDMALAGGASISSPRKLGYDYDPAGVASPDGHCRAFDASAQGFVPGEGAGIVVLKRLGDALRDRDHIEAVICASAVNNDGSARIGFAAPSVQGQAEAIATAVALAGVPIDSISYVETHGTGTPLGDLVEISALRHVFGDRRPEDAKCAIGSVKTNIGHAGEAAGIAGLLKTVLAMKHRKLPPSLHFVKPNPQLDLENSAFFVNTTLRQWVPNGSPLRAGVSSFGLGGTNAHVVIEEAPAPSRSAVASPGPHLFPLSARTRASLDELTSRIADHFARTPALAAAEAAYTLSAGRRAMRERRVVIANDIEEASRAMRTRSASTMFTGSAQQPAPKVIFMFPGSGTQHAGMAAEFYTRNPIFRDAYDSCATIAKESFGLDIVSFVRTDRGIAGSEMDLTGNAALLSLEYSLAKTWMSVGVTPDVLVGHSLGEYSAACLSGILTIEDALSLLYETANRMDGLAPGGMLDIRLSAEKLSALLPDGAEIGAINSPDHCTVSGQPQAVDELARALGQAEILYQALEVDHAYHSRWIDPVVPSLEKCASGFIFGEARIPVFSCITGDWLQPSQAKDPRHWASVARQAILFSKAIETLSKNSSCVFIEVGPGCTLQSFACQQIRMNPNHLVLASLPDRRSGKGEYVTFLTALGRVWISGVQGDLSSLESGAKPHRVPLPAYPFARDRHWLQPPLVANAAKSETVHSSIAGQESALDGDIDRGQQLEIESALLRLWQEVLGKSNIMSHENFFVIGGDSMLAAKLAAKLRLLFSANIRLKDVFDNPTLAQLAERIQALLTKAV